MQSNPIIFSRTLQLQFHRMTVVSVCCHFCSAVLRGTVCSEKLFMFTLSSLRCSFDSFLANVNSLFMALYKYSHSFIHPICYSLVAHFSVAKFSRCRFFRGYTDVAVFPTTPFFRCQFSCCPIFRCPIFRSLFFPLPFLPLPLFP